MPLPTAFRLALVTGGRHPDMVPAPTPAADLTVSNPREQHDWHGNLARITANLDRRRFGRQRCGGQRPHGRAPVGDVR
jgi:hypothetical protein